VAIVAGDDAPVVSEEVLFFCQGRWTLNCEWILDKSWFTRKDWSWIGVTSCCCCSREGKKKNKRTERERERKTWVDYIWSNLMGASTVVNIAAAIWPTLMSCCQGWLPLSLLVFFPCCFGTLCVAFSYCLFLWFTTTWCFLSLGFDGFCVVWLPTVSVISSCFFFVKLVWNCSSGWSGVEGNCYTFG
jgi:hypothetical protein